MAYWRTNFPEIRMPSSRTAGRHNNLILLSTNHDNDGGHFGVKIDGGDYVKGHGDTYGLADYVFQHNTITTIDGSPVDQSFYFTLPSNVTCTTVQTSPTHNVWILDNAMTRQPGGDCGWTTVYGGAALTGVPVSGGWFPGYMRDPPPIDPRFYGNLMFVAKTDKLFENWRNSNNTTTKPFFYLDTSAGNYQLSKPNWTKDYRREGCGHRSGCPARRARWRSRSAGK